MKKPYQIESQRAVKRLEEWPRREIRKRPGITLCVNRPNEPLRKLPYPLAAVQLCGRS